MSTSCNQIETFKEVVEDAATKAAVGATAL